MTSNSLGVNDDSLWTISGEILIFPISWYEAA